MSRITVNTKLDKMIYAKVSHCPATKNLSQEGQDKHTGNSGCNIKTSELTGDQIEACATVMVNICSRYVVVPKPLVFCFWV